MKIPHRPAEGICVQMEEGVIKLPKDNIYNLLFCQDVFDLCLPDPAPHESFPVRRFHGEPLAAERHGTQQVLP